MNTHFRPLSSFNNLHKFITPDQISGNGFSAGLFRVCQTVTSKVHRLGHAIYQLATFTLPEWKNNEKAIKELSKAVSELKGAFLELQNQSLGLIAPEQVKAAINYSKAIEQKHRLLKDVRLRIYSLGLKEADQEKLRKIAEKIRFVKKNNALTQKDLRSQVAKKINPDTMSGLHKYVHNQGHFSPFFKRLGSFFLGKGWINNPEVQSRLNVEFDSLRDDLAKISVAMEQAKTVGMVDRLERIQRNGVIKLRTLRSLTDRMYVNPGSPEEEAKESLLSRIEFQKGGLDSLGVNLSVKKRLLATSDSVAHIKGRLAVNAQGYERLQTLHKAKQDLLTLASLWKQNPTQAIPLGEIKQHIQALLGPVEDELVGWEGEQNSGGQIAKDAREAYEFVESLQRDLRMIGTMDPGREKVEDYEKLAAHAYSILLAIDSMDIPKGAAGSETFAKAMEAAFPIYNEAVKKGREARLEFVEIERHFISEIVNRLQDFDAEVKGIVADGSLFLLSDQRFEDLLLKHEKLVGILAGGYQPENTQMVADLQIQVQDLSEAVYELIIEGRVLNIALRHIVRLEGKIDKDVNLPDAEKKERLDDLMSQLTLWRTAIEVSACAHNADGPLHAPAQGIIARFKGQEARVWALLA